MTAESNARSHVEDFRWWQGNPEHSDAENWLRDLAAVRRATDELITEAVNCREANGLTWQQVGDALGITKQAAHERYSHHG